MVNIIILWQPLLLLPLMCSKLETVEKFLASFIETISDERETLHMVNGNFPALFARQATLASVRKVFGGDGYANGTSACYSTGLPR
jgi:hypothetical protein